MGPGDVEDEVVALAAPSEVLLRVVDDPIRADRPEHLELRGAVHGGHVRSVVLASCTAVVPTPPPAPLIKTVCPG